MTDQKRISVPAAVSGAFEGGIRHPELWLWDCWTVQFGAVLHLYTLAINRTDAAGYTTRPADRNRYPFHVRRFESADGGAVWRDCGAVLTPGQAGDGADVRNVWSGSVAALDAGRFVFAYTGLRDAGPERAFLQTLCFSAGSGPERIDAAPERAASCPVRDYEAIRAAGYYLGPKETLGANTGEEGGPILAWRDPFVFVDRDGSRHVYWSAKIGPAVPAVGHAELIETAQGFTLGPLSPPMILPDAHLQTQAEVPKVYLDADRGVYYLLISACDRLFEGQDDDEVSKLHRLYQGPSPTGPWTAYDWVDAVLPGLEHLFGASVIGTRFEHGELTVLAPFTEMADEAVQLSFAPVRTIAMAKVRVGEAAKTG